MAEFLALDRLVVLPPDRPVTRRRLGDDRLSMLVRLFLLHESVDEEPWLHDLPAHPLLARAGGEIASRVAVQPWRDVLVCHDWMEGPPAEDAVVGVSRISELLADLTVRRPAGKALDVGTGGGVQALLAARHAGHVVATDLSPRALELAGWTLGLNGTHNVELREGSLFEPAGEDEFDLVVANPPFIVSPDRSFLFRDADPGICRTVVEGAADRLREGGFAHVLCQWPLGRGEDWAAQPRRWVEGRGCDAWLLRVAHADDPISYAANWNGYAADGDPTEFASALERWAAHFEAAGVERIAFGLISVRRRAGANWVRSDELHGAPDGPAGEHVARVFDGQTLVDGMTDDALSRLALVPVPGLRLDETRRFESGGFELVAAQPRLTGGVPVRPRLSRSALDVVLRLDGHTRLHDLDAEAALPYLRELVALGFLVPAP